MKKWLLTISSVLFLVGCTDDKTSPQKITDDAPDQVIESMEPEPTENTEETHDAVENIDVETADAQEPIKNTNTVEQMPNLDSYEEYQILAEKIDLTMYRAELGTDNPGKRILLFADTTGKKIYKSIFIKHDRHLKIIQLDGEGLLYNNRVH